MAPIIARYMEVIAKCQGGHARGEVLLDDFDESYALPEDIEHTGGIKHV